jgi:hypothetical protein
MKCDKCYRDCDLKQFHTFSYFYCKVCKCEVNVPLPDKPLAYSGEVVECFKCQHDVGRLTCDLTKDKSTAARMDVLDSNTWCCPSCLAQPDASFMRIVDLPDEVDVWGVKIKRLGYEFHVKSRGWV